jgi:hypothetical protein
MKKNIIGIEIGLLMLLLFVASDLFCKQEKKEEESITLLSIGGKAVINEKIFNEKLTDMMEMNPYFKNIEAGLESLPLPVKRQAFDELVKQELILAEVYKNKFDETEEFKKSFAKKSEQLKKSLLVQQFEKDILDRIKIEDGEIKAYFEKNKDGLKYRFGSLSLDELKPKIITILKNDKFRQIFEEKIKKLNHIYKPEINEAYFNSKASKAEVAKAENEKLTTKGKIEKE